MLIVDKRKGQTMPTHDVIATPSIGLNRALGGGLNTGATHLFWGTPSVGKTTMCFRIIAEAQKLGYRPVIIDSESSYNDAYAAKCLTLSKRSSTISQRVVRQWGCNHARRAICCRSW